MHTIIFWCLSSITDLHPSLTGHWEESEIGCCFTAQEATTDLWATLERGPKQITKSYDTIACLCQHDREQACCNCKVQGADLLYCISRHFLRMSNVVVGALCTCHLLLHLLVACNYLLIIAAGSGWLLREAPDKYYSCTLDQPKSSSCILVVNNTEGCSASFPYRPIVKSQIFAQII